MSNKTLNNRELALFIINHVEKDNIIGEIFDHFRVDCLEKCNINPSQLDALIKEFNETGNCDVDIVASIIDIIKAAQTSSLSKANELIQEIVSYISEHLTEDISIEQIAGRLNISYYYMCHIFKNKYGISVNSFRTKKRLEIAIRELIESDKKIADIAVLCGFNNISYFTETFSKMVGVSPTLFREQEQGIWLHDFYDFDDMVSATKFSRVRFCDNSIEELALDSKMVSVHEPDDRFGFLHEAAIIEYHGVLFASWYNCPKFELRGYTPICGKRSYDGGKTWTDLEIICDDKSEKILYCPPVYGICDDKLYMLVNQMVAKDRMHALDLYVLNEQTDKFEFLWSKPIPFKLNTNVITLPNGKLMLPGRIAEQLDGFPDIPAVLISDNGKIDTRWRLVKIAENDDLPDGTQFCHPEISVLCADDVLYMFSRNDRRRVPLVYISRDFGETWSDVHSHDIPYVSSKIYAGKLENGRNYLVANIDKFDRSRLAVYFTDKNSKSFNKRMILFDGENSNINTVTRCHYPCAFNSDGKLYIIATLGSSLRGAVLFIIDVDEL